MIKIIQFLNNVGNHIGGIEQCAINYSKAFDDHKKYNIYTITPDKNICYKDQIEGKIFTVNIRNKIKLFFQLFKAIQETKPNFIILHCSRGLKLFKILSLFYRFKVIGVNHGFNIKKFIKYTDLIFCINKQQIKDLQKLVDVKKLIYFPNVTEIPKIKARKKIGKKIIIGTLSRIDFEYKNLDKIVLAAKIMKDKNMDFIFHIGGGGGDINKLRNMVLGCSLKNYFLFKGQIKDKAKFFSEIDIFCMPSKEETFGISYIEAMAHRVPCIATNTIGAMEIFSEKDSAIIIDKKKDIANQIYKSIDLIKNNDSLNQEFVQNSLHIVRNKFSLKSLIKRFIKIRKS
jgi:glycosyltransferase involved in cell wall biosynthesis